MDEQKMAFELADTLALTKPSGLVDKAFIVANHIKKIETDNKEKQELIDRLCSQEPCPKCGYGVTGACYGCEIKRLKAENKELRETLKSAKCQRS